MPGYLGYKIKNTKGRVATHQADAGRTQKPTAFRAYIRAAMKDNLGMVYRAVLNRNSGFDDEGHEQPQVVVRPCAGSDTKVALWVTPEEILIPPGQELSIRVSYIADGAIEIAIERWTRYGIT